MFNAAPSRNKPLVEFRAGRMRQRGKTVSPVTNKGSIQIVQGQDDGLVHFLWKDRTTGQVESDLTIFPGEATWKRVKQCTTGRVYILEFKGQDRRLFFWMQEPSEEKDEEYTSKVNQYLNNPPAPEAGAGGGGGHGFGDIDQNQLLAMMGGAPPTRRAPPSTAGAQPTAAPSTAGGAGAGGAAGAGAGAGAGAAGAAPRAVPSGQISNEQLQNILSGLGVEAGSAQSQPDASLPTLMNAEDILPLLNDPQVQERLLPLLPEGTRSREELQELLRSPQFQQAVSQFNSALQSGQLNQLMPLLGLPATGGGGQGGVDGLLRAVQERASTQGSPDKEEEKDKKDEDKKDEDKKDEDKMDESH